MKLPKKLQKKLRIWSIKGGIILLFAMLMLLFNINIMGVVFSILLIILASFSKIYKRFTSISLGFELVTPATLWFAHAYGILFATIACLIMLLLSAFVAGKLDFAEMLLQWVIYIGAAVLIAIFGGYNFIVVAIIVIIIRIIVAMIIFSLILGANFVELGIYLTMNTFLNILIILTFSQTVLYLL